MILNLAKKYDTLLFTLFQVLIFSISVNSENRLITIGFLTYFYYSTFTGWHECVHKDFSIKGLSLNKILGMANMVPLLLFNYRKKLIQHLLHHKYTNDPLKDPDYKSNNLIIASYFNRSQKNLFLDFDFNFFEITEIILKIFYIIILIKFWILNNRTYEFIFSYLLGVSISHLFINIAPHYKYGLGEGRNFKFSRIFNLILLGNNFHGLHHRYPNREWWKLI